MRSSIFYLNLKAPMSRVISVSLFYQLPFNLNLNYAFKGRLISILKYFLPLLTGSNSSKR
jgi:hypothetical protein